MEPRVIIFFALTFLTSESVLSQLNPNSTAIVSPPNKEINKKNVSNTTQNVENKADSKTLELMPIYSEGGSIPARLVVSSKPQDKLINSINNLESKLSLNSNVFGSATSVKSPIHGRKGVKYPKDNVTDSELTDKQRNNTSNSILDLEYKNKTVNPAPTKFASSTEKPKSIVIETSIPLLKKPTKTISSDDADDQGELKKSGLPIKSSLTAGSSLPNLVVPFGITALVLPLFAILGYYALKHGREAWKNRHYRRMDFLLDGMYND